MEISQDILGYLQGYLRISIDIFERYYMDIMWITQGYKHWISYGYLRISIRYLERILKKISRDITRISD